MLADNMPAFICKTCGVQYPPSDAPPDRCQICDEERRYVGAAEVLSLPAMTGVSTVTRQ